MNVLGKVARGVGGYIAGADAGRSEAELVQQYLQHISDGESSEERQDAVAELRDLLEGRPEAQVALGNGGFHVLIDALRKERSDLELVRGVLECLAIAVQPEERESHRQGPDPSAINAELLAKSPETVPLLLGFLEEEPAGINDFYVRYHAVQLLTALAASGPYRLQEAILSAPMGVVRLMDLLGDAREVLRNEALLLLAGLTRSSPDIQKIVAFEGAFERILQILREEGWAQGGIVVQDCLELVNNLLRNNPANQLMFRETGHLSSLAALLQLPAERARRGLPRQVAANLLSAIDTFLLLITPPPPVAQKMDKTKDDSWMANRAALMKQGILDHLLALAVGNGGVASPPVRAQALACIERLITGIAQNQEAVMSAKVIVSTGAELPALQAILQPALKAGDAREAAAAEHVLQAFFKGNPEGQRTLAATLTPVGDSHADSSHGCTGTFGGELVGALMGPDAAATARAAAVLAHLLRGNAACKQQVLATPLEVPQTAASVPVLLLPQCCRYLGLAMSNGRHGEGGQSLAVCAILRLLITWAQGCPSAVNAVLEPAGHIPMLLDLTQHKFGPKTVACNGLAAVLLGVSLLHCPAPPPDGSQPQGGVSAPVLLDIISSRIGLAAYFGLLDALKQDKQFLQAAAGPTPPKPASRGAPAREEGTGENPFDHEFAQWLPGFMEQVHNFAVNGLRRPSSDASSLQDAMRGTDELQSAKLQIASQQRELEELQRRLAQSNGAASNGSAARAEQEAAERVRAAEARCRQAEGDAATVRSELTALQGRLETSEREAARLRGAAEEARAAAARLEADLEGLSGAYNSLETHRFMLEARVRQLESSPEGGPSQAAAAKPESEAQAPADEKEEEADDGLNDLLICLGQEEQKVERLRAKLEEMGVDVDVLLEGIGNDEQDDEEAGAADEHEDLT